MRELPRKRPDCWKKVGNSVVRWEGFGGSGGFWKSPTCILCKLKKSHLVGLWREARRRTRILTAAASGGFRSHGSQNIPGLQSSGQAVTCGFSFRPIAPKVAIPIRAELSLISAPQFVQGSFLLPAFFFPPLLPRSNSLKPLSRWIQRIEADFLFSEFQQGYLSRSPYGEFLTLQTLKQVGNQNLLAPHLWNTRSEISCCKHPQPEVSTRYQPIQGI